MVDGLMALEADEAVSFGARDSARNKMIVDASAGDASERGHDGARAAELLMGLATGLRVFRAGDGRFHVRVPVNARHEILGLRSNAFRDWLVDAYVSAYQKLPPQAAVNRVLEALEARARFAIETAELEVRVGCDARESGSSFYLDLGDASGRAVEIGAGGWAVVENPSVHFRRPRGHLALPMPSHDGSIELLRPFVNVVESEFRLLVAWMAAALRPAGPYPILVISGEQGAAKSTLARVVRQLIDPQAGALLAEPRSTQDLMITANNGWLLAYDNMSALPGWLSDSLCRLASGCGFATRALFSDQERLVLHACRPVILNGIDDFVRKGDLIDRCVFLRLPAIEPTGRREEDEFWRAFHEAQPQILGGLINAVVTGLRTLPTVNLGALPRMADFARFGEAVGRGLGWPDGEFLGAYAENRREATMSAIEASVHSRYDPQTRQVSWFQGVDGVSDQMGRCTQALRWKQSPLRTSAQNGRGAGERVTAIGATASGAWCCGDFHPHDGDANDHADEASGGPRRQRGVVSTRLFKRSLAPAKRCKSTCHVAAPSCRRPRQPGAAVLLSGNGLPRHGVRAEPPRKRVKRIARIRKF